MTKFSKLSQFSHFGIFEFGSFDIVFDIVSNFVFRI
jgi:hypothetical protein